MLIDPSTLTLAQTTFLGHISEAFDVVTRYALNLLYLFAAIELAVFGLLWAFQQSTEWGKIFFKIIKIGLVFFIIQNYPWLLNSIVRSFAILGGMVANTKNLQQIIFNPTGIWQYGYDVSLGLLKAAALGSSFGLTLIQTALGTGILLVFGLLGIQIVLQIVGFYLVALVALILLPFGVFNPSSSMLSKGVQNVFKAGVRVMALIAVIGVAITIFNHFDVIDLTSTTAGTDYNINQFLGLFFTGLLFLCLAVVLPKLAAEAVGEFSTQIGEMAQAPVVIGGAATTTSAAAIPMVGGVSEVQAATSVAASPSGLSYAASAMPQATTATAEVRGAGGAAGAFGAFGASAKSGAGLGDSAALAKALRKHSIAADTLKKLNTTLEKLTKDK